MGGCRSSDKAIRVSLYLLAPALKLVSFSGRFLTVKWALTVPPCIPSVWLRQGNGSPFSFSVESRQVGDLFLKKGGCVWSGVERPLLQLEVACLHRKGRTGHDGRKPQDLAGSLF